MGTYQEWQADLYITEAAFAAIKADPTFATIADRAWYKTTAASLADWTIEDLAALIAEMEGSDAFGGPAFGIDGPDEEGGWRLAGGDYGKLSHENDDMEQMLARCGVTGTIDFECEGERGRTVIGDSKVRITPGITVYGDDFNLIMDTLRTALRDEGLPQSGQDRIYNAVSKVVNSL